MTTFAEVEAAARALPPEDRRELGRRLLDEPGPDESAVDAPPPGLLPATREGVREAEKRLDAYWRGETAAYTLEETLAHSRELSKRYAAGQSREEIKRWLEFRPEPTHFYSGPLRESGEGR